MPEFRTGRALVGGLPSGKTEVRQSQCVVMKSTDVRDRELVHGQTLDFLTTDADVEAVDDVEAVQNVEAEVDVEAETAALPIVTGPVVTEMPYGEETPYEVQCRELQIQELQNHTETAHISTSASRSKPLSLSWVMELAYNERLWNTEEVERVCGVGLAHTTPVMVSTFTEPFTLRMSCAHGSDVVNEVGKPGLALKQEDISTSVANLDDKQLLKIQTSVTLCSVDTAILPTAVESQEGLDSTNQFAELVIDTNNMEDVSNSQRPDNVTFRSSYMPSRDLEPPRDIIGEDLVTTVLTDPAAETAYVKWEQHYKISVPALVGQEDPGMDTGSPATQPDVLPPPHTGKKLLTNRSIKFSDSQHWELELDQQLGSFDNAAHTI